MLRTRLDMSRMAGRLLLKVVMSVTATLIASMLFSALPKLSAPATRAIVELTSGGKYAARIPDVAAEPLDAAAPASLASLAAPSGAGPSPAVIDSISAGDLSWSEGPLTSALDKPARGKPHPARTALVRHAADAVQAAAPNPRPAGDAAAPVAEEGVLPKVMSSARSLWSLSASAGGVLLSHLTP